MRGRFFGCGRLSRRCAVSLVALTASVVSGFQSDSAVAQPNPQGAPLYTYQANPSATYRDGTGRAFALGQAGDDLNGDDSPDFVVGSPFAQIPNSSVAPGSIEIVSGFTGTEIASSNQFLPAPTPTPLPLARFYGGADKDLFGFSLASMTDTSTSISLVYLLVGAPGDGASAGPTASPGYVKLLTLFPGFDQFNNPTVFQFAAVPDPFPFGPANGYKSSGSALGDEYGFAVAVGNFHPNPGMEFAVGAPGANNDRGTVTILDLFGTNLTTLTSANGGQPGARFGQALTNIGDKNSDGFDDLAVGSPLFSAPGASAPNGKVELVSATAVVNPIFRTYPGPASNGMTSFGAAITAVHTNRATPVLEQLVVGAPTANAPGQQSGQSGAVYGYDLTGTSTLSVWTLSNGTNNSQFGVSVARGGDLNLDNRDEILVGAAAENLGRGYAHIYNGTSTTPTLRFSATDSAPNERLGQAVHNFARQIANGGALLDTLAAGGTQLFNQLPGIVRTYQNTAYPPTVEQVAPGSPPIYNGNQLSTQNLEITVSNNVIGAMIQVTIDRCRPGQPVLLWGHRNKPTTPTVINGSGATLNLDLNGIEAAVVLTCQPVPGAPLGRVTHSWQILNSTSVIGARILLQAVMLGDPVGQPLTMANISASNTVRVGAGG